MLSTSEFPLYCMLRFPCFRYNCNRVLVTNVLALSFCLAFIPVWSNYYVMLVTVGLLGVNMGMIDTVANVNLIKIHGREVSRTWIKTLS
jgi:hypothetical protein